MKNKDFNLILKNNDRKNQKNLQNNIMPFLSISTLAVFK